jgi:nickel-dependent lactate racemase
MVFRMVYKYLRPRVKALDVLVALGTHRPLSRQEIAVRVGVEPGKLNSVYPDVRFFNHAFSDPDALVSLGSFSDEEIRETTEGLLEESIDVTINRKVTEYYSVLLFSPVVPHESMGFSGGDKMFFPGVSGEEFLAFFHWLAAIITNPKINGVRDNPVRRMVDRAAAWIEKPCFAFCMVVQQDRLKGFFTGTVRQAWTAAVSVSEKVHIRRIRDRIPHALGVAPSYYEDIWVAGKVMYKLEPVIADSGEVIIYAPHITQFSATHEPLIRKVGYHIRDYILQNMEKYKGIPREILAHSTNVRGTGTMENGTEKPRIRVTLATGIPEQDCLNVNLGYRNPADIDLEEWKNQPDRMLVDPGGLELYRLSGTA